MKKANMKYNSFSGKGQPTQGLESQQVFLSRQEELQHLMNEDFPTVTVEELNGLPNFMAAEGFIENNRLSQVLARVKPHGFFAVDSRKNGILLTEAQLNDLRDLYIKATLPQQKDIEILCKASRFSGCRMAIEKLKR